MHQAIGVGILNDLAAGPPGPTDIEQWLRFVVNEYCTAGRIRGEIDFINAWGLGLPAGSAVAVERAYEELVARNALIIVGPAVGDNALIATPLAERHRVPTLNWAGSENARGEYMFHLQVGSHEDESIVLARYFASTGVRHVGVVYDDSPIGHQHFTFLKLEADRVGLNVAAQIDISPLAENADRQIEYLLATDIDALVYLGLGISAPAVARALTARAWRGQRAMNTAGIRGYAPAFEGRLLPPCMRR